MKISLGHLVPTVFVFLFLFSRSLDGAPIEAVHQFDVQNPGAFTAALDQMLASNDIIGNKVVLWAKEFGGVDKVSHVIVTEYDSYAAYEKATSARLSSPAWPQYLLSSMDTSEYMGSVLVGQQTVDGSGWRNHGALAAYIIQVKEPATYTAEFKRMINAMDNPGSVRLMQFRAGGQGATHVVLVSAESFTALNEFLDTLYVSDAFASFNAAVKDIRTIINVEMYSRLKTWEK